MMEMGKMVPQVIKNFEIGWAAPEEDWKIRTFWFAKQSGLHVRFRVRNKGSG